MDFLGDGPRDSKGMQALLRVRVDGNAALGDEEHPPQVVDAVRVVGVRVREEYAVDVLDARGQQLLAQVGGCVDQHGRAPLLAEPLDQQRATPSAVLGIGRIAVAPDIADARHTARGAAAQDREAHAHAASAVLGVLA